ncbi:1872_t:CDS:2, partial [Acaulospora morrowiae]
ADLKFLRLSASLNTNLVREIESRDIYGSNVQHQYVFTHLTMSYPTLYNTIKNNRFLHRYLKPLADYYANLSGYRQLGLRYDDIIIEENSTVQEALRRLSPQETDLRNIRIRNAYQLSLTHKILPKEKWTKPEEDVRFLTPIIEQVAFEEAERESFEAIKVVRKAS